MGDAYITAFAKGLKISNSIRKINLTDNRLKESGVLKLVQSLNKNVHEVNLSDNRVGFQPIEHLSQ